MLKVVFTSACRATEDFDDGVPLGGLAKLSSNVAGMVAGLEGEALSLRRISPSRFSRVKAVDPTPFNSTDAQLSPKRVGILRGSAGSDKGSSLAATLERAESENSVGSAAGLLRSGSAFESLGARLKRDARYAWQPQSYCYCTLRLYQGDSRSHSTQGLCTLCQQALALL